MNIHDYFKEEIVADYNTYLNRANGLQRRLFNVLSDANVITGVSTPNTKGIYIYDGDGDAGKHKKIGGGTGISLEYSALIGQSGAAAPTESKIFNESLRSAIWTYISVGRFSIPITANVLVYLPVTEITLNPIYDMTGTIVGYYSLFANAGNTTVFLKTYNTSVVEANGIIPAGFMLSFKGRYI